MGTNHEEFEKVFKKAGIDDKLIGQILSVQYQTSNKKEQDNANYCAAVIDKCNELLDFDVLAEAMFHRACCKSGFRLSNAKEIAKEHADKTLEEKLELLGQKKYMGKPHLTEDGKIYTEMCAGSGTPDKLTCSCWRFKGCVSSGGKMPVNYCLCCAGHFRFHYQTALGLKLRVHKIVSSVFGEPPQYCSFLFDVILQPYAAT